MSAETDYIAYLETKVLVQDFRINELEASLMLIFWGKDNNADPDSIYLTASVCLLRGMPFSQESINVYKENLKTAQKLNDLKQKV